MTSQQGVVEAPVAVEGRQLACRAAPSDRWSQFNIGGGRHMFLGGTYRLQLVFSDCAVRHTAEKFKILEQETGLFLGSW